MRHVVPLALSLLLMIPTAAAGVSVFSSEDDLRIPVQAGTRFFLGGAVGDHDIAFYAADGSHIRSFLACGHESGLVPDGAATAQVTRFANVLVDACTPLAPPPLPDSRWIYVDGLRPCVDAAGACITEEQWSCGGETEATVSPIFLTEVGAAGRSCKGYALEAWADIDFVQWAQAWVDWDDADFRIGTSHTGTILDWRGTWLGDCRLEVNGERIPCVDGPPDKPHVPWGHLLP